MFYHCPSWLLLISDPLTLQEEITLQAVVFGMSSCSRDTPIALPIALRTHQLSSCLDPWSAVVVWGSERSVRHWRSDRHMSSLKPPAPATHKEWFEETLKAPNDGLQQATPFRRVQVGRGALVFKSADATDLAADLGGRIPPPVPRMCRPAPWSPGPSIAQAE